MQAETRLEMAERRVREGEVHVARQKEIFEELRRDGHPTLEAEALLRTFEQTLASHRHSRELIRRDQPVVGAWD